MSKNESKEQKLLSIIGDRNTKSTHEYAIKLSKEIISGKYIEKRDNYVSISYNPAKQRI